MLKTYDIIILPEMEPNSQKILNKLQFSSGPRRPAIRKNS